MFRMKAMRYYRLWIYTCNLVLLISVLLFVAVGSYVFGDARMSLVTSVRYYHPTFLYAYAATVLQGGVIQVIGCIGALRLNERLLQVYWLVLLLLLCGDIVVGTVWVFRFQRLCAALPTELAGRLSTEYGVRPEFTALWDHVQWAEQCCGLFTPADYNESEWRRRLRGGGLPAGALLPASCCAPAPQLPPPQPPPQQPPPQPSPQQPPVAQAYRKRTWQRRGPWPSPPSLYPTTTPPPPPYNGTCYRSRRQQLPSGRGCLQPLLRWYRNSADLLFVLGYCVIAFLKLCFLGLLRYEIREMIQKIKVLESEGESAERVEAAVALTSSPAAGAANHTGASDNNNGRAGAALARRQPALEDVGNTSDSETNSHCALLGRAPPPPPNGNNNKLLASRRGDGLELLELQPHQQTDI